MEFRLSKEQEDIQRAAREFAQGEFDTEVAAEFDKECRYPIDIWKRACELGFIGMHFPEKYGGQGLGLLENVLVIEEFCRQHSGIGMALGVSSVGSGIILRFGSDDQKERYLRPVTSGKSVLSVAYAERNRRKDLASFKTTATRNANEYVVKGNKSFVFNSTLPGAMIVLCELVNNKKPGEKIALMMEKGAGVELEVSNIGDPIGMRMVPIADLTFTEVKIPHESLIGHEGQGQVLLMSFLNEMNIVAAAIGAGIAQGSFDLALAYARQREQFGRKIASFEAIRDKLADMATRIEIAKLLTYKAGRKFDTYEENPNAGYMAKMISAETALEVARDSLHIFGGYGYIVENQIERFYRDASMVDIIGIQGENDKSLIADQIIGNI